MNRREKIMPPKAKFTRREVIEAALELVRKDGPDALTARGLAAKLGSSARPIFTLFQSMDEVAAEVKSLAMQVYEEYVDRGLASELPFKGVGTQYILFAMKEPKLFQLLFMAENSDKPNIENVLTYIEDNYSKILMSVKTSYNLDDENALRLYRHLWIYTHGIATLCATSTCSFTAEQISEMMTDIFTGLLKKIKTE